VLTFLHLSDIHFSELDGPAGHQADERVRELMLDDIELIANRVGPMDAILLVGDVANTGKEGEYRLASEFLDSAANLIGCEREKLCCVPGNHDIDRDSHDGLHEAVRRSLRVLPHEEVSESLQRLLREERGADVLLDPLSEYNRFALQYGCAIDRDEITWKPKAFNLDGSGLLVHGATSAWICDATDFYDRDEHRIVVGDFQCLAIREPVSIAMIHHPARWVRDAQRVQPWLNRAQVLLTGHEHAAGIEPQARRVQIASGAVTPERTQRGWVPAYNVLRLRRPSETILELDVYVRCWQAEVAEFGPDSRFDDPHHVAISLERAGAEDAEEAPTPPADLQVPTPEPIESNERTLVFHIMRAAPDVRHRAARSLGLVGESDAAGLTLDREILERARAQNQLSDLKARIDDD
jgi:predicted phosphodiesterase